MTCRLLSSYRRTSDPLGPGTSGELVPPRPLRQDTVSRRTPESGPAQTLASDTRASPERTRGPVRDPDFPPRVPFLLRGAGVEGPRGDSPETGGGREL